MTLEPSLDKHRGDFTHNYTKIRLKCPECVRIIKGGNHVKVHKNLAGLWRHIKTIHGNISNSKFNTEMIKEVLMYIAKALEWGILPDAIKGEISDTATSLTIIYDGKPARGDVLINLKEIAELLKIQSGLYPHYRLKQLYVLIEKKLGPRDKRTIKKYFECITKYSATNMQNGTYDIAGFCGKF